MTLEEFYRKLENHDWFWEYCDDGRAWREGREAEDKLFGLAEGLGTEFVQLAEKYREWQWSHGTGQKPVLAK